MTKVDSTGPMAPTPPPETAAEVDKGGEAEFDRVMDRKADAGEGTGKGEAKATGSGDKPETARATEHGVERRHERREGEQSGEGEGRGGSGQSSQQEALHRRPVPGDMMIPFSFQAAMQQIEVKAAAGLSTTDAVAQIQRIANQIVDAVQVRMNAGGSTEVHMELNMGALGNMSVELHRAADGQLKVDFKTQTVDAQDLLKTHMSELTSRLEARGLNLQQLTVRAPDLSEFKWQPPPDAQQAERLRVSPSEVVIQPQAPRDAQFPAGGSQGVVTQSQSSGQPQLDQKRGSEQQQEQERKRKQEEIIEEISQK
ncbi:MAG: flagellar hook-length control protein FliK [Acidobacteriota bacterium]